MHQCSRDSQSYREAADSLALLGNSPKSILSGSITILLIPTAVEVGAFPKSPNGVQACYPVITPSLGFLNPAQRLGLMKKIPL